MKQSILYDANCKICQRTVAFIKRREVLPVFEYIPYDTDQGQRILKKNNIDFSKEQYIVYIRNRAIYIKSSAVLEILKDIGGVWRLLYLFKIVPVSIRDYVYRLIAANRYRFRK